MEFFSEIYSCYYQVLRHLLCSQNALTIEDIRSQVFGEGFGESLLSIVPKLESKAWNLFERNGDLYISKISPNFFMPLSSLEKSYLKALMSDSRIGLFLDEEHFAALNQMLNSVTPLWKPGQFFYFDQFADGDPYMDSSYRKIFRTLLSAQKHSQYVDINYSSPAGKRIRHCYVPARLEYSVKNDKFRLLALKHTKDSFRLETLNVSRIQSAVLTGQTLDKHVDLNALIKDSYYKEPLKLHIANRRNALERAMLHFANYEKNTRKLDSETYECLIYYNQSMETELLIEVLSFGPMLTVIGNEKFLRSLKKRLQNQMGMMPRFFPHDAANSGIFNL